MSAPSPQPDGNRKDPRARVLNMTVRYRSATVDEFIENHSHDISRGGMFIKTRSPFPAGTLLKFEVRIAEDQKLMHGVGRVVWRREAQTDSQEPPPGMGIKFIKTGEGAAALIGQLVNAREGKESNFEAGERQQIEESADSNEVLAAVELGASGVAIDSSRVTLPPLDSSSSAAGDANSDATSNAVAVSDLPPRETEILVSSPPKARTNHSPERRKVVLNDSSTPSSNSGADKKSTVTGNSANEVKAASEPPATLPPRAQRAPESAHGAAVSPKVAKAALAAAEAPRNGPSTGSVFALLAAAAAVWFLLKPSPEQSAPEQISAAAASPTIPVATPQATGVPPTNSPVAVAPTALPAVGGTGTENTSDSTSDNAATVPPGGVASTGEATATTATTTGAAGSVAAKSRTTLSAVPATNQASASPAPVVPKTPRAPAKPTVVVPVAKAPTVRKPTVAVRPSAAKHTVKKPIATRPKPAKPVRPTVAAPVAPSKPAPPPKVAAVVAKPAAPAPSPAPAKVSNKAPEKKVPAATAKPAVPTPPASDDNPY